MVRAKGMRGIVTEVFFENAEYVDNDAVFGVRKSLIAKVQPFNAEQAGNPKLERQPDAMLRYDFVLAPQG
jgi:hydroxyquinol 1,2-dioxygenase